MKVASLSKKLKKRIEDLFLKICFFLFVLLGWGGEKEKKVLTFSSMNVAMAAAAVFSPTLYIINSPSKPAQTTKKKIELLLSEHLFLRFFLFFFSLLNDIEGGVEVKLKRG